MSQDLFTANAPRVNRAAEIDKGITPGSALPSGGAERQSYLILQASSPCVRIEGHRRRVEAAQTAIELAGILETLMGEDFAEGAEEYVIRKGKKREKRKLSQLMRDAMDPNLKPEERDALLERVRTAVQHQLVREKLERVEGIHRELKAINFNDKMTEEEKKLAVSGVLLKALNNGLISEDEYKNFLDVLNEPGGITKVIRSFGKKLDGLQTELRKTAENLRKTVEETDFTDFKNTGHVGLVEGGPEPDRASVAAQLEAAPIKEVLQVVVSLEDSPRKKHFSQTIIEALEELCEAKRKALMKEKGEQEAEEQLDQKREIERLKEVLRELQSEVQGVRISDIQVVLAPLENLSREALRQLILDIKNMFGGSRDLDRGD